MKIDGKTVSPIFANLCVARNSFSTTLIQKYLSNLNYELIFPTHYQPNIRKNNAINLISDTNKI